MKSYPQMEPVYDEAERSAMDRYLSSGAWLTEHKETEAFANEIAKFTGAKHCVVTNNGTISLSMILWALGIGSGDEVLVPNFTMIATPNSVKMVGANPVFIDVERQNLCLDLEAAAQKITPKTKAMMYVAFNGRSGDMNQVKEFCDKHKIYLIEDAAQALGAYSKNRHLGTFGIAGSFSFSTPKIITTGQGGAIITDDAKIYEKLRKLKDFGRTSGGIDIHDQVGYNFKFTDMQAVIGREQMKKLPERIVRKKEIYKRYQKALAGIAAIHWVETDLSACPPWFYDIFVAKPDQLSAFLKEKNIGTRRIYPPIHAQAAYQYSGSFPVTEEFANKGLWLPSSIRLTDEDIDFIGAAVRSFFN